VSSDTDYQKILIYLVNTDYRYRLSIVSVIFIPIIKFWQMPIPIPINRYWQKELVKPIIRPYRNQNQETFFLRMPRFYLNSTIWKFVNACHEHYLNVQLIFPCADNRYWYFSLALFLPKPVQNRVSWHIMHSVEDGERNTGHFKLGGGENFSSQII
jgi:hypothetical protein